MWVPRRIEPYARSLGLIPGLATAARLAIHKRIPRSPASRARIPLPGMRAKVVLRPRSADVHAFWQVFIAREYDIPIAFEPRLIVDAGAHVGFASLYFSRRFPGARLVAIEPDAENASLLAENLAGLAGATLCQAALWPRTTRLRIANPHAETWSFRVMEDGGSGRPVECITMERLLDEHGDVDILKLDIEGAEGALFAGDVDWLSRVRMVIIELHERHAPGCTALTYDAMRRHGLALRTAVGENVVFERVRAAA
jgi:FkbM family methyltransferase